MTRRGSVALAAAVVVAGAMTLALPATAQAHGWGRGWGRGRVRVLGGYYGYAPWVGWGWGWGPYYWPPYGPYADLSPDRIDPGLAMIAGVGAVHLDVKPKQAEVWVDGKYVAEARDLDGSPSLLWLKQGEHTIALHESGYRAVEQKLDVRPGTQTKLKVRMEKGDPAPPADRAAATPERPPA
jgi:hypothetical protein